MDIDRILNTVLKFLEARQNLRQAQDGPDYIDKVGKLAGARADVGEAIEEGIQEIFNKNKDLK